MALPSLQTGRRRASASGAGTTLVELLVTTTILAVLASAALPIAAASQRREKEIRLRRALRELRVALNTYHAVCLQSTAGGGVPAPGPDGAASMVTFRPEDDPDLTCYPKDLDVLLEGVETNIPRYKLKFLRRVPKDPFNRNDDEHDGHGWAFRSTTTRPDSIGGWDRRNVFDVHSASEYRALDGSRYEDW